MGVTIVVHIIGYFATSLAAIATKCLFWKHKYLQWALTLPSNFLRASSVKMCRLDPLDPHFLPGIVQTKLLIFLGHGDCMHVTPHSFCVTCIPAKQILNFEGINNILLSCLYNVYVSRYH